MSSIEEVGARIVFLGQKAFHDSATATKADLKSIGDTTKAVNTQIVQANQAVIDSQAKATTATKAYADARQALADKVTVANAALAAGDTEAATAAKAEADSQRLVTKSLQDQMVASKAALTASRMQASQVKATAAAADAAAVSTSAATTAMKGLASVGKVAFLGTTAAVSYLGYEGVKRMATFNDQITRLGTLANVPTSTLPALSKWAQQQSPGLLESVTTLADQMYRISSANSGLKLTTTQLENMTKAAAQLSVLGGPLTDPEQVARVFGILTANGGLGLGTNYQKMGATAGAIVGTGDMTMNDLIDTLGKGHLAPTAAQYGISFGQLGGIIANMGDLGINGSMAGNTIQHALTLMGTPVTKKAQTYYSDIGLAPDAVGMAFRNKDAMGGMNLLYQHLTAPLNSFKYAPGNSAAEAAQQIGNLSGLTPAQDKQLQTVGAGGMGKLGQQIISSLIYSMFGGAKQGAGVLAMVDTIPREGAKNTEINKTVSESQAKVNAQYATSHAVFQRWDLDLQQIENRLGVYLIPKILDLGNKIKTVVGWLQKHHDVAVTLAVVIGGILLTVMAAWIVSLGIAAIEMVTATWPILAIIAAVGLLAFGIRELWVHWDQIWTWMGDHKQYAAIILIAGMVLAPFLTIPIVLAMIATHWSDFWTDLKTYAGDGVNDIIGIINDFTGLINTALGWAGVHIPQIGLVTWGQSTNPGIKGEGAGISANNAKMMATGGLITNTPTAIVGEGNPAHPEWVIPTDPAYRARALSLFASLGTRLMAGGGSIIGKIGSVAKSVVDPFGLAGKAAGAISGLALGPVKDGALTAANALPAGLIRQLADGLINKIFTWASGIGAKNGGGGSGSPGSAGGAGRWASTVQQVLTLLGLPMSATAGILSLINSESGGNPNAINLTDSNARAGHPSQGLMQTIPGTFAAYAGPYASMGITNPLANIYAGVNYALKNYGLGMLESGGRHNAAGSYIGYARGGVLPVASYDSGGLLPVGASVAVNGTGRPEPVGHGIGTTIELHIHGSVYGDRKALLREVQQAVGDAVARR